jgi:uncharacterized protein YbbK (DUF523 family)
VDRPVVLVSACLAGVPCRYDAQAQTERSVADLVGEGAAIAACPEVLGGLRTPRPPAEIVGGDGHDVLAGTARVVTADGRDLTAEFLAGARAVADLATEHGVGHATLQDRSPSCGCGAVYDGTHTGRLVAGDGILTVLLRQRGVTVTAAGDASGRA